MSWRTVVISNSSKLDYKMGYLVVRSDTVTRVHLSEIRLLMVETTSVSLTAALLAELAKNKIKVVFCDEKRNPSSELVPYYGSHDTSLKVRSQIAWDDSVKSAVWTEIVAEKIHKQEEHLLKRNLVESAELLHSYVQEIAFADETNREGHAAKVYFNSLFGKDFTRTEENSINAALNYGYSLILSLFNREITANGYITQLGLFHDNMFNPFNLASDLMEPFRILVDVLVANNMPDKFETEEKKKMLDVLKQEVTIAGKCENVSNAISIYAKSVFDALNDADTALIKFYKL